MKIKNMRQQFIGGGLVSLSVISLALFGLQLWTSLLGSPSCLTHAVYGDSRLAVGGFYWWTTILQALLVLSLVLVAVGSLVSLRLARRPEPVRRYSTSPDRSTLLVPPLHPERVGARPSQNVPLGASLPEPMPVKLSI